jgi:hypothetical protein
MARIDVEVDTDDILWSMSKYEKQEMADALYDDGIIPTDLNAEVAVWESRIPQTNLEKELADILDKVWDNRRFISNDDLETLKYLSKKGLY